jgi:hypothetical protein
MCGRSGATRTGTIFEYDERFEAGQVTPRRDLVCQTDRLRCDRCGGSWDEVADIHSYAARERNAVRCATDARAVSPVIRAGG